MLSLPTCLRHFTFGTRIFPERRGSQGVRERWPGKYHIDLFRALRSVAQFTLEEIGVGNMELKGVSVEPTKRHLRLEEFQKLHHAKFPTGCGLLRAVVGQILILLRTRTFYTVPTGRHHQDHFPYYNVWKSKST